MRRASVIITIISLVFIGAASVWADVLVTPVTFYTGDVVRSTMDGITIKVGDNELTLRRGDIQRAEVAKPAAVEQGQTSFRAAKYAEALAAYGPLVEKYAGIPLPWVEESMLRLGDVQIALKDYAGAKKTFDSFRAFYPKSPRVQELDAKYARIFVEQKQPEKALKLIQGALDPLLKRDYLTEEQESGVAEGLVLMADCQVAAGKLDDGLDNYMKVIALFDVDPDRTAEAKYKAGKILEERGNWKHAKENYDEVVKEMPEMAFAEDAKKRLADLSKAHPE